MQVVIDSLLTNYQRQGKGKLVLLIHGWADSLNTFSGLQTELAKSYEVISVDLPGFGASQIPPFAWRLDDYARFLHSFINKVADGDVFAIVGHSNGGALALRAIATGELKPKKLVLLDSAGIRPKKTLKLTALKVVAKTGKAATVWLPEAKRQNLRKKLYGVAGSDMLAAPHMQETFKATVRQDIGEDASKLQLPTLLIYGSDDKATPVSYGQKLARLIQGSKLDILTGAGHFVHHDQLAAVQTKIEEFLSA